MSPAQAVEAATAPLHAEIARLRAELAAARNGDTFEFGRGFRAGRAAAVAELEAALDEVTVSLQGATSRVRELKP